MTRKPYSIHPDEIQLTLATGVVQLQTSYELLLIGGLLNLAEDPGINPVDVARACKYVADKLEAEND